MKRYEYRVLDTQISELGKKQLETHLNAMGAEGWRLVSTLAHERHGYSHEVHLLFSRSIEE